MIHKQNNNMATYEEIQKFVKKRYRTTVKTCHIAHAKEILGLPVKRSWRRIGERKYKVSNTKLTYIDDAFRHFNMK